MATAGSAPRPSTLLLDTRDLPRRAGSMREVRLRVPSPGQLGAGVIVVPSGEELDLEIRLESVVEGVLITAQVDTVMSGECGHCLEHVEGPLSVTVQQLFSYPGGRSRDVPVDLEGGDAGDDLAQLIEDHADLAPGVTDAVVLALPFSRLCDDSCPRLAQTRTRLGDSEPVDPRWAGLAGLREQLSED